MNKIKYLNFNIFKRFFNKNKNSDLTRSSDGSMSCEIKNQIILTEINKLVKNDFDVIYGKIDNLDNKIKNINNILDNVRDLSFSINEKHEISDKKINLVLESMTQIIDEMRKSEEIVLINN